MSTLVRTLFSLSLSGSLVALLLLALRPLYRGRFSRAWQYYIWGIVVLRLLIPLALPVRLPAFAALPSPPPAAQAPAPEAAAPAARLPADAPAPSPEAPARWPAAEAAVLVWGGGALLLLVRQVTAYRSFVRFVKAGRREAEDPALLDACAGACEALRLRRMPEVYVNPLLTSPMLVGVVRPFIVLPGEAWGARDAEHVFLHELTHLRRGDALYKWAAQLAVCVHWFNPVAHLVLRQIDRACELSCDEAVTRRMDAAARRAYGDTLVGSIRPGGGYLSDVVSVTLCEDARQLKERLECIMKRTGGSAGSRIGSVCVGALAACVALVSGGTLTAQAYEAKAGAEPRLVDWQGETAFDWSDLHTKGNFFLNRVYFKNQYIIGLAGNVDPGYYPVKRTLQWEGKDYPLCFAPGMEAFADNGEVLEAARQCLGDLIEEYSLNVEKFETKVEIAELTTLLVTSVAGPYTEKPDVLAERFFAQRELSNLAAVAREVSPGTADALAGRAYEEREVALFSIVIDRASGAKLEALFDRAVEEREVAFASILSGRLPGEKSGALEKLYQADMPSGIFEDTGSEEAYALAKRAYEDDKIAFFSQLADDLSADKARELAMRAYKDDKMAFFSHLADGLSAQDAQDLAVRAYEDDKIAFFSQLADDLSADKARELAMRAYKDDKIAFFSHLADGLSAQDAQDLAVRAYEDGKIAFFSHLADALTAQQRAQLRERAYRDNELAFFTHLFD